MPKGILWRANSVEDADYSQKVKRWSVSKSETLIIRKK